MPGPQQFNDADPSQHDEPLIDQGRSLPLRLLALLGAFAFVMLGVSSVVMPLLLQPSPPSMPDQRHQDRSASA
jgi:hypothetical protein